MRIPDGKLGNESRCSAAIQNRLRCSIRVLVVAGLLRFLILFELTLADSSFALVLGHARLRAALGWAVTDALSPFVARCQKRVTSGPEGIIKRIVVQATMRPPAIHAKANIGPRMIGGSGRQSISELVSLRQPEATLGPIN